MIDDNEILVSLPIFDKFSTLDPYQQKTYEKKLLPKKLINDLRCYLGKLDLDKLDEATSNNMTVSMNSKLMNSNNLWRDSYNIDSNYLFRVANVIASDMRREKILLSANFRNTNERNRRKLNAYNESFFSLLYDIICEYKRTYTSKINNYMKSYLRIGTTYWLILLSKN